MKLDRILVFDLCKTYGSKYGFDPFLIMALVEQESGCDPHRPRLEPRFHTRFIEKQLDFSIPVETLLSISFGLTQMMGESLRLAGYFDWHWGKSDKQYGTEAMSRAAFIIALDEYVNHPEWQIEWGCKWLSEKRKKSGGSDIKMLGLWNGDQSGKYAQEVLIRIPALKKEFV